MCGIGGFLSLNSVFDLNLISKHFKDGLIHRGPDSQGEWFSTEENMVITHTRLSILDLSENANQPMKSEDGNIVLTFNGEIYNYDEIKKELAELNAYNWFTDHSDTEVIIHAYEQWGISCLSRFRGIFAFGLWDNVEKTLYVARDRFGVKPVYYISKSDHFGFSSELKPFFKIYEERKLNKNAIIEYLAMRGSIAPNTMVEGMYKLDKGCCLKVKINKDKNTVEKVLTKYYDINKHIPVSSYNYAAHDQVIKDLEQQLITSIKYRWISDTPVCLFLSGGLDSSLIAAISSNLFNEKIQAFTVGLPGNPEDETRYAQKVAEQYNLNIHIMEFSNNPFSNLDNWLYYNDDLLSDPSAFAIFCLSKEIRNMGFKVVLSGEGADEIFAGYGSYNKYCLDILRHSTNGFLKNFLKKLYTFSPHRGIEKYFSIDSNNQVYNGAAHLQTSLSLENLITDKAILNKYNENNLEYKNQHQNDSPLDYALKHDLEYRIPNDLLLRTDRATMASGIEARVPFLDHKLVEYAMSIPSYYKTGEKFNEMKVILKELALKYFDKEFVYRPKQGFPIPVNQWLLDEKVVTEFDKFIRDKKIDCLNYKYIKKIYQRHKSKKDDYGDRLFNIYLLEKYVRYWNIEC